MHLCGRTRPNGSAAARIAEMQSRTTSGLRRSELPAPFPVTMLDGQPQLRSTRCAPWRPASTLTASASRSGSEPMICAERVCGRGWGGGGQGMER